MSEESGDEVSRFEQDDSCDGTDEEQLAESPLAYLQRFCLSQNLAERQLAVRHILKSLQSLESDRESVERIFALVKESFVDDKEHVVRTELLEQLPLLCIHCAQSPSLSPYVNEFIIPLVVKFLSDPNGQVRKTCHAAVLILVEQELISTEELENRLVPVLLSLTDCSLADEIRIESAGLLCKFIPTLGHDKAVSLVLPRFSELCRDQVFHIRKICASSLGEASKVFGQEITEKFLVPQLVALSSDNVWGVRKAAAECFTDVSLNCSMKIRQRYLASVFIVLLGDSSRWVQSSAFEALGPFISTFADSKRTGLKWVHGQLVYEKPEFEADSENDHHQDGDDHEWQKHVDENGLKCGVNGSDADEEYMDIGELLGVTFVNSEYAAEAQSDWSSSRAEKRGTTEDGDGRKSLSTDGTARPNKSCLTLSPDDYSVSFHRGEDPEDSLTQIERELDSLSLALNATDCIGAASVADVLNGHHLRDRQQEFKPQPVSGDNFSSFEYWRPTIPEVSTAPKELLSNEQVAVEADLATFMERRFSATFPLNLPLSTAKEPNDDGDSVSMDSSTSAVSMRRLTDQRKDFPSMDGVEIEFHNGDSTVGGPTDASEEVVSQRDPLVVPFETGGAEARHHRSTKKPIQEQLVPKELLENFLSMVEPSKAQSVEIDISKYCAYNLPAVAYTMGRENWSYLKDVYRVLSNDIQWKVRRTLAFSAHQLAAICGPEITRSDIFPVVTGLLRDVDEVRIGILKHLYDFIKLLDKQHRKVLLSSFADFLQTDNYRNWRFRQLLAEQLTLVCQLYDLEDLNEYLTPIAMTLAVDKVADVRLKTYPLVANILRLFYMEEMKRNPENTVVTDKFLDDIIKALANSQRWMRRQTFVYICQEVIMHKCIPEAKFVSVVVPVLHRMANDRIPNVRIVLGKVLYWVGRDNWFLDDPAPIDEIVKRLVNDPDKDVRDLADIYYRKDG